MATLKKVVIVGAGPGGQAVAQKLDKAFDVTLIERNAVYHHNLSALRATVDPRYRWLGFQPITGVVKAPTSRVVQGEVVEVTATEVKLADGSSHTFDYLVLATGSSNPFPARAGFILKSAKEGIEKYDEIENVISKATKILLVGGGPVGVELAGEIKAAFPSKEVTLLHRGATLLNNQGGAPPLPAKFTQGVADIVNELKINLILGDSIPLPSKDVVWKGFEAGANKVTTAKGKDIEYDLVFWCTGSSPNTEKFKDFLGSAIDDKGLVKVNGTLQVEGHTNIFAIGDITNVPEPKLLYVVRENHAPVVVQNIKALDAKKPAKAVHKPFTNSCFMIVGPNRGISQVGFLPGFFGGVHKKGMFATMKNNKKLFVEDSWKTVTGTPVPAKNPYA